MNQDEHPALLCCPLLAI